VLIKQRLEQRLFCTGFPLRQRFEVLRESLRIAIENLRERCAIFWFQRFLLDDFFRATAATTPKLSASSMNCWKSA